MNQVITRGFHMTARSDSVILTGGLAVAAVALGAKYAVQGWEAYKSRPAAPVTAGKPAFRGFYKGGFAETMTRREAALILGVRESATPQRIKEKHRMLLMANHPDTGGSTFLAGKINEAKEMLLNEKKTSAL